MRKGLIPIIVLILVGYFLTVFHRIYWREGGGEAVVTIAKGATLLDVEGVLLTNHVLTDDDLWLFDMYARMTDADRTVKAGTFTLRKNASIADVLAVLASASGKERSLTFIEGWSLRDIAKYLVAQGVITKEDELYRVTGFPARDYRNQKGEPERVVKAISWMESKPANVSLEGYLFPDTYRFYSNATVDEVVQTLVNEFDDKFSGIKFRMQREPGKFFGNYSFFEVLTMASILEAEVRGEKDQRFVSDIMWRRLEKGWPLQVDSSVNYVTEKDTPSASAKDIKNSSPYNTYKHKGLPPGPINNPGLKAFESAMNPEPNEYWFFLTGEDGSVHYARTLEEHKANRKYL